MVPLPYALALALFYLLVFLAHVLCPHITVDTVGIWLLLLLLLSLALPFVDEISAKGVKISKRQAKRRMEGTDDDDGDSGDSDNNLRILKAANEAVEMAKKAADALGVEVHHMGPRSLFRSLAANRAISSETEKKANELLAFRNDIAHGKTLTLSASGYVLDEAGPILNELKNAADQTATQPPE